MRDRLKIFGYLLFLCILLSSMAFSENASKYMDNQTTIAKLTQVNANEHQNQINILKQENQNPITILRQERSPRASRELKGDTGAQGFRGDKGDKEDKGCKGCKGPKGDKGDTGPVGPPGPMGPKGDTGAAGPQGPQGLQGPKGDTGATGEIGSQGPQGIQGKTGAAGPVGPQGPQGPPVKFGEMIEKEFYNNSLWETTTYTADTDGFVFAYINSLSTSATPDRSKVLFNRRIEMPKMIQPFILKPPWVGLILIGCVYTGTKHPVSAADVINCRAYVESDESKALPIATIFMPVQKSEQWTVMKLVQNVPGNIGYKVVWLPLAA